MSVPQKSWETSRKRTRNLESTIDARLTTYSQLASRIASSSSEIGGGFRDGSGGIGGGVGGGGSDYTALDMDGASFKGQDDEHKALENELDDLLNQLSSSVDELTSILDDPTVPPTTSQLHAIQRHREVLMDFTKDYRRSKTNVRHAIDRRDLMGTVRGDIDAYKARHASDADALLAERGRIDNSHQMIDSTLDQAYATRADFASQGSMLNDISTRMGTTAAQVPGLNSIITLIGRRRRRDSVIMGCLIGTCTVLLLMFMTR